jgi:sigma-B regulation protein RsbU (phosphoserine phosphatase)
MSPRTVLVAVLLSIAAWLPAQSGTPGAFNLARDREPVVVLDGSWRFHPGDDPDGKLGWDNANFDDSTWPLIRGDKSWNDQGYKNLDGFAWYRTRIEIPAGQQDLALYIPMVETSYQVFADGKLLGGEGGMPPHIHPISQRNPPAVYRLPPLANPSARTVVLAIRVWHWPGWDLLIGGGLYAAPLFGQTSLIQARMREHENGMSQRMVSPVVSAFLETLAGLAALGFFLLRPREKEYLWFSFAMLASAGNNLVGRAIRLDGTDVIFSDLLLNLLQIAYLSALIAFFYRLLGGRRGLLFWIAVGSIAANSVMTLCAFLLETIYGRFPHGGVVFWNAAAAVLSLAPAVWVLALVFRRAVQGFSDARLLLAPVVFLEFAAVADPLLWLALFAFRWNSSHWSWFSMFTAHPFPISVPNVCEVLFLVGMLAIFVHRFTRTSLQEEGHRRELESARVVQQVLIPEAIPQVPGFAIESVYEPAGEVGGDFFQILPTASGGVLAVIGDVSGKGTPAAMTVSLLVGTVRTLAHFTQSPGAILTAMNQRMLGRSQGGFTTCLVLRADADGALTVANAGHIAPYLTGKELPLENGLSLGLAAEAAYSESIFQLAPGEQLTLLTDGVVEAREKDGVLFGFERTAALSIQPAEAIAAVAKQFGQDDDITVLTLTRLEVGAASTAHFAVPIPHPA